MSCIVLRDMRLYAELKHVVQREKAWAIRSYPCTGLGVWLQPLISSTPIYQEILHRAQSGETIMDIGCFLGVDLRRLARDGAPSNKLIGVDIVSHWDVGYFFFRDQDRFSGRFIEADLLRADESPLAAMQGSVNVVSISLVLHQWNFETQRAACVQMTKLTNGPGALVLGFQCGTRTGTAGHGDPFNPEAFWHDEASMARCWDGVGGLTRTKWETRVELWDMTATGWKAEDVAYLGEDVRLLHFIARRLE